MLSCGSSWPRAAADQVHAMQRAGQSRKKFVRGSCLECREHCACSSSETVPPHNIFDHYQARTIDSTLYVKLPLTRSKIARGYDHYTRPSCITVSAKVACLGAGLEFYCI